MTKSPGAMAAVSSVKARIDHGFSRLGPKLDLKDPAQRMLMILAGRTISLSNAVVLLTRHDLSNEAAPLLFSLWSVAARAAWIAEKDSSARAGELSVALRRSAAEWLWDVPALKEHMRRMGMSEASVESLDRLALEHAEGNIGAVPWSHALPERLKGLAPEEVLDGAAKAVGRILKALNDFWPDSFDLAGIETEETRHG